MILLLLKDGSHVEISDCTDVIHRFDCLLCLNSDGAPLMSVATMDVQAYTLEPHIARQFMEPGETDENPLRSPRLRRFRRRRWRTSFD